MISTATGVGITGVIMQERMPEVFDKTRSTIKAWITEHGCKFAPTKNAGWVWGYVVQKGDHGFNVYQLTGHPEMLVISLPSDISDYNQLIEQLPPDKGEALLFEVRFALLGCDVEFEIPNNVLKDKINLSREIFVADDLTRTAFWDKVFAMHKAELSILWAIERRIPLQ